MPAWGRNKQAEVESVVFWCQLWSANEGNIHGTVRNSPAFNVQVELTAWIRANRREDETIYPYRRVQSANGYKNEQLLAHEPSAADTSGRLALLADLVKKPE